MEIGLLGKNNENTYPFFLRRSADRNVPTGCTTIRRPRGLLLGQAEVVEDRVQGRDQEQHLEGRGGEAEPEARDERLHDLGLEARLREEGQDPGHGGEGGEQDGAESLPGGPPRRVGGGLAGPPVELDERDEHDRVVHHHPRERGEADHARHGEVETKAPVPPDRPDEPRRDHRHHQDRLDVAPELEAQQQVDGGEAEEEVPLEGRRADRRLLRLSLERRRDPGVPRLELREEPRAGRADDLLGVRDAGIHVASDGDRAPAVDPVDAGVAARRLDRRHRVEGHLVPRREGDRELGEVREAVPVPPGETDVDLVVFRPELDLGRVAAVEGGPELPRHRGGAEPEGERAFAKAQPRLRLAGTKVVREVPHPAVAAEPREQLARRGLELPEVLAQQPDVDGPAAGSDLGLGELEGDDVGDLSHRLPPPIDDVVESRVAGLGGEEIDGHRRDVRPRFVGILVAVVLDPDVAHEVASVRLSGGVFLAHPADGAHHQVHDRFGPGEGRALGKEQPRLEDVALDVGERPELELASRHHGERRDEKGHDEAHREIAPGNGRVHQASDEPFGEAVETCVEAGAEPCASGSGPRRAGIPSGGGAG